VPYHPVELSSMLTPDITVLLMAYFAFRHGQKHLGTVKNWIFLLSSILFAGAEETVMILTGRFGATPTYYFTYGGLWFFEIPVYTCIAWYMVCYCGYIMAKTVFPKLRSAGISALTAAFGTCWDLWLDPVVCNRHLVSSLPDMWIWLNPEGIHLFGIPFLNFVGWFGVIFMIIFVFDKSMRDAPSVGTKSLARYYVFLAIAWGALFGILHLMAAAQLGATVDLIPLYFGAPVNPNQTGSIMLLTIGFPLYFALLMAGIIYHIYQYRKTGSMRGGDLVPVFVIVAWLIGTLQAALLLLATFPASNLAWIILACSAYPVMLMLAYMKSCKI
jgi:uncharacterized membrane protein